MVSYVPQVREKQIVRICMYVYVCVAPPMIVGAWSMAIILWQLYEYYVLAFNFTLLFTTVHHHVQLTLLDMMR